MSAATRLPQQLGPVHFIGIGGIGMSGIAEVLLNHGYVVQGSDLKSSRLTERLARLGARIWIGQRESNVDGADVVVVSSAIRADNPELRAARNRRLPVVRRADMLAELMRLKLNVAVAGTHGKTTTTTLVATLLDAGGMDPTVINGGIIHAYGSNARVGRGEWMVVEADESDGSFNRLPATIAVVTNIDPEHMEHYGTFDALRQAFQTFVSNIPFYGAAICNNDHAEVRSMVANLHDRRVIRYGFGDDSDVCGLNLAFDNGTAVFDLHLRNEDLLVEDMRLPMLGEHNVSNSLAAIAVARHLGLDIAQIREALGVFRGVNRRFTHVGTVNGVDVIDDYAHHPVELAAALRAARQSTSGRVVAVHQPHRYTRLHSLFDDMCGCFGGADVVAISEVYAAGESPIEGADRDSLVSALRRFGHRNVHAIEGQAGFGDFVDAHTRPGDLLICLGAGSISAWAHDLVSGAD
ncbi:MAG: UDP-N-acetylmuramate--L-alanine ligase [Rhodobacteraceae bacterium]|nr:UDP-N-acetylmuramate--L-alanine ligase [Paracoccaceae bacterium]MCY4138834.1 UDP-N-acetylmuramate--L-alanine ligase [Paracoccaceae bacterium]